MWSSVTIASFFAIAILFLIKLRCVAQRDVLCIENKYIFFNYSYVHSHLKYTHIFKISLKYILNIVKYEYLMFAMLSEEAERKYELKNVKQFVRSELDS